MSNTLKQLIVASVSVAALAGCASSGDQQPPLATVIPVTAAEEAKPAAPVAAPATAAAAEAPKTQAQVAAPAPKVATLKAKGLFDFNKSVLRPDAKAALDADVVQRKGEVKTVKTVTINGHADRLGSHDYNQKLSEKRAEAVKAYLVGQGVPANNIETNGFGKTQPATGVAKCDDSLGRKKLIECLQPHRRVEVELKGEAS